MKHSIFLLLMTVSLLSHGQSINRGKCINGPSSMPLNSTEVYTTDASQAYYWTVTSGLEIVGSNTGISVTVKCTGSGGTLTITKFNNGICSSCSLIISCSCNEPTAYFIPTHDFFTIFKTQSTISPSNYTSLTWSSNDSRVQQINPINLEDPTVTLYSSALSTLPDNIQFTASLVYPNGCEYDVIFNPYFFIPTPFGPLENNLNNDLNIYPNPVNNKIVKVIFNKKTNGSLRVIDISTGNEVKKIELNNQNKITIDLSENIIGIYQIVFTDSFGDKLYKKIIID